MKNSQWKILVATGLVLGFSIAAHAELVSEDVADEALNPEQEVVVVKKLPSKTVTKKRKVVVNEVQEEPAMEGSHNTVINNSNSNSVEQSNNQISEQAQIAAPRKGIGSTLDNAVDNKMTDVRNQFEQAIVKSLDRIQVKVDDGSAGESASGTTVNQTTVVQDNLTSTAAAASAGQDAYLSVENAPKVKEEHKEDLESGEVVEATSVAKEEVKAGTKVKVSPILGFTSLKSDTYNIDSRYTAGVQLEVELDPNLSAVFGYSYSQYDVTLGSSSSFYNYYQPIFSSGNTNKLQYNQNVFDGGLRFYVLPKESKFRVFAGAGIGYNKGYLNYKKSNNSYYYGFNSAPGYMNTEDYEVTSWLGNLEAGAEIKLSQMLSIGGLFKYSKILSARENQSLNNYWFVNNGSGYGYTDDKNVVGGSISENDFYSILGTVSVSF